MYDKVDDQVYPVQRIENHRRPGRQVALVEKAKCDHNYAIHHDDDDVRCHWQ